MPLRCRIYFQTKVPDLFSVSSKTNKNKPGTFCSDVQYVGSRTTSFDQSPPPELLTRLDAYTLSSVRVGTRLRDWQAELFIINLFDEQADLVCCRGFWDPSVNRPRTVGLRLVWDAD